MLQPCIAASALVELVGFSHYPKVSSHMLLTCSSLHFPVLVSSCHLVMLANTLTRHQSAQVIWGKTPHHFYSSVASLCSWYWPQNLTSNVINGSYFLSLKEPYVEVKLMF